jgi:hypothetical protein
VIYIPISPSVGSKLMKATFAASSIFLSAAEATATHRVPDLA